MTVLGKAFDWKNVRQANLHCHNFFTILSGPALRHNGDLVTPKQGRHNQRSNLFTLTKPSIIKFFTRRTSFLSNALLSAKNDLSFYVLTSKMKQNNNEHTFIKQNVRRNFST